MTEQDDKAARERINDVGAWLLVPPYMRVEDFIALMHHDMETARLLSERELKRRQ